MKPEKRTSLYMTAAHMGAIGTPLLLVAIVLHWPDFAQGFFIGILVVSLTLLLWRRLRDEYIEQLWNAGTSWAFAVIVLWFLFLPFSLHLGGHVLDLQPAAPTDWAGTSAIFAFFIGFHLKWLRSRA